MSKNKMSSLATISKAIEYSASQRENERKENEKRLGKPFLFVSDPDNKEHGIGYFKITDELICAYRHYSNGYERYPSVSYEKSFIDRLYKAFKR
jgi:hypothetical protein